MDKILSGETMLERMKLAINIYYQSLNLCGPYEVLMDTTHNRPIGVWLNTAEGELMKYRQGIMYICDLEGSRQLETVLSKVSVLGKGITWPLVALELASTSMQWIMTTEIIDDSSQLQALDTKFWFIISLEVQSLFEFTISLLQLQPAKKMLRCTSGQWLHNTEKCQNVMDWDMPLCMVIASPGDLLASISDSFYDNHGGIEKPTQPKDMTKIMSIRDKKNHRTIYASNGDTIPLHHQDVLEHHFLTQRIAALTHSQVNQVLTGFKHWLQSWHQSEVTIKEEPLYLGKIEKEEYENGCRATKSEVSSNNNKHVPTTAATTCSIKTESMANDELIIQCAVCPYSFQYGLCGEGIDMLIEHVHLHHKRLISHCSAIIRNKYSKIIEDRKRHMRSCTR